VGAAPFPRPSQAGLRARRFKNLAEQIKGEAWVLGQVDGDAEICDLVVISEHAHVGGRTVVCGDEVVRGEARGPRRAVPAAVASALTRAGL